MVCCQHQILQRNGCKGHVTIKNHLLPHSQQFTRLYTEHIHSNYDHMGAGASRKFHLGISSRVATIGPCFWVSNLTKLVKSIRHKCIHCKVDNQRVETQSMGKFLAERLKPNAAWNNTSLDFFRPFTVKGEVNKRARGKAYGILVNCLACRAVHLELTPNYSTEGFCSLFDDLCHCAVTHRKYIQILAPS